MPDSDQVFIKDLVIEMSAGIYDHEKQNKQRVIVSVVLDVETNAGKANTSIDDVVSYEDVKNNIEILASKKHYDLLEEFAEGIASLCLENNLVKKANVTLGKPDIFDNVGLVGIEILRP